MRGRDLDLRSGREVVEAGRFPQVQCLEDSALARGDLAAL
jgi:hypothetical protein